MARGDLNFQYRQIALALKGQILRGELRPGVRLPSERLLGERFQVQRNTVRQALALLETEGHIATEERRGSYVLAPAAPARGGTLVVNIHRGTGPNLTALYEGFSQVAEQSGFRVRRRSTNPLRDSEMNVVPDPETLPSDTAGLILWPHQPIAVDRIRRLNEHLPLVLVDQHVAGVQADCVRFDDLTGGKLVTAHLLEQGHKKIAFLTDEVFAETVQSRWHGYVLAHEEAGIHVEPRLSLLYQQMDAQIFAMTLRHLLEDTSIRSTAVVCSNDVVAFRLLRFLHSEGVRVPEDLSITGYGNSMPDYMAALSLTTVEQPFHDVGREAARLLCQRSRQTSAERLRSPEDIVLPVRLVCRGSTQIA